MPDANGQIKGHGWSRRHEAAYARVFGNAPLSDETLEVIRLARRAAWLDAQNAQPDA